MSKKKLFIGFIASAVIFAYTGMVAYASVNAYKTWIGTEEYQDATSNLDKLGLLLSGNNETIAAHEATIKNQKAEIAEKESSVADLSVQLGNLRIELGLLQNLLGGLGGLLGLNSQDHNDVLNKVEETVTTLELVESNLETAQEEVSTLSEELESEKQVKEQLQSQLSGKDAELEQAKKDMEDILHKSTNLLEEYGTEDLVAE